MEALQCFDTFRLTVRNVLATLNHLEQGSESLKARESGILSRWFKLWVLKSRVPRHPADKSKLTPNICGSTVWNFVILLAPGFLERLWAEGT